MKVLVIDAQGGGVGKQLVAEIKAGVPDAVVTAIGANSTATMQMKKAGADISATGENPVIVGCKSAEVIMGPIGIAIADSMYGEITPKMAVAVGQSQARKIFIPISHCANQIAGVGDKNMKALITDAVELLKNECCK